MRKSLSLSAELVRALFATLLVCCSAPASAAPKEAIEDQIRAQIASLWKAWETQDRALASQVYHQDFTDIDFAGERRGREAVLAYLPPTVPALDPARRVEIKLSDFAFTHATDDVVVVSYLGDDSRYRDGKVVARWRFRANDTFVKGSHSWQLVSGQQALVGVPDAEAEVLAAQDRFAAAVLANDAEAAGRTLHENWTFTAPAGWQANRQKFLSDMGTFWKPTVQRYEDSRVAIAGKTAVVTGRAFFEWNGGAAEEQYTDVYAYQSYGQWLKVATHHSCIEGDCSQ